MGKAPAAAVLALGLALVGPATAHAADLAVFAADSLKNALDEVVVGFAEDTGRAATVSCACVA